MGDMVCIETKDDGSRSELNHEGTMKLPNSIKTNGYGFLEIWIFLVVVVVVLLPSVLNLFC